MKGRRFTSKDGGEETQRGAEAERDKVGEVVRQKTIREEEGRGRERERE